MAFSKDEKERRIAAAQKRLDKAKARAERHKEAAAEAVAEVRNEREAIEWLESMPTDEPEVMA